MVAWHETEEEDCALLKENPLELGVLIYGELSPPRVPHRAHLRPLNRRGCASLISGIGPDPGGIVERESQTRFSRSDAKDRFAPTGGVTPCHAAAASLTALSMDFVAKPAEAQRAQAEIPGAVSLALKGVAGYAGCLALASDQEARLITVITFWVGGRG